LIYSPIMPLDIKSGKNAQIVASVVVVKTTLKSFSTNKTASSGVNLPVFIYCLVALTTTIASSTKSPKARSREKIERKFKDVPVASITPKVEKNTKGIASPATKASFNPTIRNKTPTTKTKVIIKS